jgi:hypothetical protein
MQKRGVVFMSAFMSFCDNAMFTLFGSTGKRKFSKQQSLFDNFISMCSLSSLKSDSTATLELKAIIKENDFMYNNKDKANLSYHSHEKSAMEQFKKIDAIKRAIIDWEILREKTSSRVRLIRSFKNAITGLQNKLLHDVDLSINLRM